MGIEIKTIGTLIDELITTDIKCFMAQEPGGDLKKAQELNKRRNELIQAIDRRLGDGDATPTGKTYQ